MPTSHTLSVKDLKSQAPPVIILVISSTLHIRDHTSVFTGWELPWPTSKLILVCTNQRNKTVPTLTRALRCARSMLPSLSTSTTWTFMPAIWALAGLVPWADLGIRQTWIERKKCQCSETETESQIPRYLEKKIMLSMKKMWCSFSLGVNYNFIPLYTVRLWLQDNMSLSKNRTSSD